MSGFLINQRPQTLRGRFRTSWAQRGHSANYDVAYPGNTPANHPPTEARMIHSKQHRGCRVQDPETCGKHQTIKKQIPGLPAGAVGCRPQNPGTCGYRWRKKADFSHSAGTARAQRTVHPLQSTTHIRCEHRCRASALQGHLREPSGSLASTHTRRNGTLNSAQNADSTRTSKGYAFPVHESPLSSPPPPPV